jgi:glycosyltransferase involved in cell wall biosynthesis
MSAGMKLYAEELRARVPRLAPDLKFVEFGSGDNFDFCEQVKMPNWIASAQPRLVHYPAPFAPFVNPQPYIVTIHDLIELSFPQFSKSRALPYYRFAVGRLARRAKLVICDDPKMVDQLRTFLGVRRYNVRVVPLGASEAFAEGPLLHAEPEHPYLLYVGNRRKHKSVETLLLAWSQLPSHAAIDLRLTGEPDEALRRRFRLDGAEWRFLGDLDKAGLIAAYRGARALVHPSLAEGFGLTMLEASALGTPVIATHESLPQLLAGVALTFGAGDVSMLRDLIERAARHPLQMRELGERAAAVARRYTWERCAAATIEVYREALQL